MLVVAANFAFYQKNMVIFVFYSKRLKNAKYDWILSKNSKVLKILQIFKI